ncbi:aspartate aminotransferase family protein [Mangrovihabitans endophyticus]|uniref:glutamate-1-semialdehyde 2,1-aminomutase n=1 Tax=Mangrovihabitans endophyticus TaxID=1751298 RepID=A0A8J3C0R8_9ACTN|nr:aminotransferase class III-fold pyridoxal phosphate-dependent enzyme [Mangrovihabitans endophyticus]GGK90846.1 glutamate-1-semialdehyde 2,1-aminomutase [Mangrovihabitans endophyticus]
MPSPRPMAYPDEVRRRAEACLVSGVSRGFNFLPEFGPLYFSSGTGSRLRDVGGHDYLDLVMGWGSLLLGHNPPVIADALRQAVETGSLFQHETVAHIELAEFVARHVPCAEKVRFTGSGLEATLYATRVARAHTGRRKILKFEGHFHGMHDATTLGLSSSPLGERRLDGTVEPTAGSAGVPDVVADLTLVVPYNDLSALESAFRAHRGDIAAVIMEPIAMNMGCIAPAPGYLAGVRQICAQDGAVLIFDEVLTGFRVGLGGAQAKYGVTPDLACFSKAFGCGLPIAALAGRADLMALLGPPGPVPMSGTNSARLLVVAGALAAMRELAQPGFYDGLEKRGQQMAQGLATVAADAGIAASAVSFGGRTSIFFGCPEPPANLRDVASGWDADFHTRVYRELMTSQHVYGFIPLPNAPDPINVTAAHSEADIEEALDKFATAVSSARRNPT